MSEKLKIKEIIRLDENIDALEGRVFSVIEYLEGILAEMTNEADQESARIEFTEYDDVGGPNCFTISYIRDETDEEFRCRQISENEAAEYTSVLRAERAERHKSRLSKV